MRHGSGGRGFSSQLTGPKTLHYWDELQNLNEATDFNRSDKEPEESELTLFINLASNYLWQILIYVVLTPAEKLSTPGFEPTQGHSHCRTVFSSNRPSALVIPGQVNGTVHGENIQGPSICSHKLEGAERALKKTISVESHCFFIIQWFKVKSINTITKRHCKGVSVWDISNIQSTDSF